MKDFSFTVMLGIFRQRWSDGKNGDYKVSLLISGTIHKGKIISPDKFKTLVPKLMQDMIDIGDGALDDVAIALGESLAEVTPEVFHFINSEGSIPLVVNISAVQGWSLLK